MKKNICFILAVSAIMATGCEKTDLSRQYSRNYGDLIVFGSNATSHTDTKAAYSGVIDADGYERIDWSVGDHILIHCVKALNGPTHEYAVVSVNESSDRSSSAEIESVSGTGCLEWGESGTYVFTSVSPAPGSGISGTAITDAGTVTCVLPETQDNGGISETVKSGKGGDFVAKADAKCIYLTGYATAEGGNDCGGPVQINYDPAFTAFQITVTNGFDSGNRMNVTGVGLKSASDNLTGKYKVNVTGINATTGTLGCSDIEMLSTDASKEAKMTFGTPVSVAKDSSLTFTLFAQPAGDVDSLTFWFTTSDGCKRSFAFRYNDEANNNPYVKFTAFHKARITGLISPESSSWTINMQPLVTAWKLDAQNVDGDEGQIVSFTAPTVSDWAEGETGKIKVE